MGLLVITQVKLDCQSKTALLAFEDLASHLPGIRLCLYMSGKFDFLLHFVVSDMAVFEGIVTERLGGFPGIGRVENSFVLHSYPVTGEETEYV